MKNKWLRMLVCFILVCGILVNISPIRAEAIPIDPFTIGYVTKEVAFWAISLGLGISFGVEAIEQASRLADNFATWSVGNLNDETVALMQDDMIQLMATGNPDMPWMVDSRLVDGVREWMFESETVTGGVESVLPDYSVVDGEAVSFSVNGASYSCTANFPFSLVGFTGSTSDQSNHFSYVYGFSSTAGYLYRSTSSGSNSLKYRTTSYTDVCYYNVFTLSGGGGPYEIDGNFPVIDMGVVDINTFSGNCIEYGCQLLVNDGKVMLPISVSEGLTAYQIAPKDEDFTTGYSEWSAGAVTVPAGTVGNTSDITALPIGIGKDLEETISATQADVWKGVSTYTDTSTDVPGTDTEDGTGTGTGSGAGAGVDLAGITQILNNIHSFQQSGTIGTQTKVDGLGEILGDTNTILNDSKSLLSSILAANAFGFDTVQQSVISLPGAIGDELTDIEDLLGVISGSLAGTKTGVLSDIIAWVQALAQDLAGVKEKVESLPTDIAEAVSQAIVPSATAGLYALDLTEFFPFCLPYDIYDFLTILRASPQAPAFTFPISAPSIGFYYEIEIDLSPWNDVAALFRKLELFAFCVGLAYVSREKFLRA